MAPIAAVRYNQQQELEKQLLTLSSKEIDTCTSSKDIGDRACDKHTISTREKYAAKLQALGCLCRALLALGQESCCAQPQKSSLERKRR